MRVQLAVIWLAQVQVVTSYEWNSEASFVIKGRKYIYTHTHTHTYIYICIYIYLISL